MKYLDRGPQVGDEVEVTYRTKVVANDADCWGTTTVLPGYHLRTAAVDTSNVRVIVPDPKVGDVVTTDMDLPEGSIIEWDGNGAATAKLWRYGDWFHNGSYKPLRDLLKFGDWRIARIGGAS